ncbi:MAG: hypothetical protein ABIO70_11750 [Pseudomonadota bacterium]
MSEHDVQPTAPKRAPQPLDEATVRAAAAQHPCCRDATSLRGWGRLKREHPKDWDRVLRRCFPEGLTADATLGDYLRAGAGGLLVPAHPADQSVKKKRAAAIHLAAVIGHLMLSTLDEAGLEAARATYLEARGVKRPSCLGSDLRVLRHAAHNGRMDLDLPEVALVWSTPRPRRKVRRRRRSVGTPEEVRRLIEASPTVVRIAIVLFAGMGLLLGEALALRVEDLDTARYAFRIRHAGLRGPWDAATDHLRPIPLWGNDILQSGLAELASTSPRQLLFASPRGQDRPMTNLASLIRQAAIAAGLCAPGDNDPRWTPSGLRLLYQALARGLGLPRALVRGTIVLPTDPAEQARVVAFYLAEGRRLANHWFELVAPPRGLGRRRLHVPRRAPRRVPGHRPEVQPADRNRIGRLPVDRSAIRLGWYDLVAGVVPPRAGKGEVSAVEPAPEVCTPAPTVEVEKGDVPVARVEVPSRAEQVDAGVAGAMAGFTAGVFVGANICRAGGRGVA